MIHDMASAILEAKTGDYAVKRRAVATAVKGRAVPGAVTNLSIAASVTPVEGEVLADLGLDTTTETKRVITSTKLYVSSAAYLADLVTIDGEDFEVTKLEDWSASGGFFLAYVTKVGRA